jgi:histidine triad (HIT) family protein
MHNHAPTNYHCPFCQLITGVDLDQDHSVQTDIVYRDEDIVAFIARDCWPNNPGHVLICPIEHYENIYDLPERLLARIYTFEKPLALAIKNAYRAEGISSRQHNEPIGGQDVWHFHVAVFPRFKDDELYLNTYNRRRLPVDERKKYGEMLRAELMK